MNKTLYLIRHGVIRSNEIEVYAGRNSESLTHAGEKQAARLAQKIKSWGIELIYTSPLRRTVQTAEILNQYICAEIITDEGLIEMDLGHWTGLSKEEVWREYPSQYRSWIEEPAEFKVSGIETLESVTDRVIATIDRFVHTRPQRIAAFVTHAVAVKAAVLYFRRQSKAFYHQIEVPNLSVHRVMLNGAGETRIERLQ
jgi:phosphoserine phosphatase